MSDTATATDPAAPGKTKRTLWEIGADLEAIESLLTEIGGDVSDEEVDATITKWLAEAKGSQGEKVDRYCGLILELQYRSDARKAEADRLRGRAKTDANAADRLKDRLLAYMQATSQTKIETEHNVVTVRRAGGVPAIDLIVASAQELPAEYRIQEVSYKADTEAIRAALEAGEDLDFAKLRERGVYLAIK